MKATHEKEAGRQHIENGFTTYGYEYDNFFFVSLILLRVIVGWFEKKNVVLHIYVQYGHMADNAGTEFIYW